MAKKNLKKSNIRKKSVRAIQQEQERAAEEQKQAEELRKAKQKQKEYISLTKDAMLGIYSILASVISWLVDYMGIIAAIAVVLAVFSIRRNRTNNRKYLILSVIALILGIARLIMELYGILHAVL